MPAKKKAVAKSGNDANLGFEQKLGAAANQVRGHMDVSEYKHFALDLTFLKYITDAFKERQIVLLKETDVDSEDRDGYTAVN